MTQEETVAAELKAAGASLVLAMAAAENGDWAAAEQGVIDAQERSAIAMKDIQAKLAEPPTQQKTSKSSRIVTSHAPPTQTWFISPDYFGRRVCDGDP